VVQPTDNPTQRNELEAERRGFQTWTAPRGCSAHCQAMARWKARGARFPAPLAVAMGTAAAPSCAPPKLRCSPALATRRAPERDPGRAHRRVGSLTDAPGAFGLPALLSSVSRRAVVPEASRSRRETAEAADTRRPGAVTKATRHLRPRLAVRVARVGRLRPVPETSSGRPERGFLLLSASGDVVRGPVGPADPRRLPDTVF